MVLEMAVHLSNALDGIQAVPDADDGWIDTVLDERIPRRIDISDAALRIRLEQDFLTPSTTFSSEWLNNLQQCVPDLTVVACI
jgi:antiviral helicase SKI2